MKAYFLQQVRYRLFLGLFGVCLAVSSPANAAKTLIIAADTWCPINCEMKDTNPGIGVDLAKKAFGLTGYEVKYITMPWMRALEEVRKGQIDMVVGANIHDDPTLIYPKTPIYHMTDDFYVRRDNPIVYNGLDSLKRLHTGTIRGYGYGPAVGAFLKKQRTLGVLQEVSGEEALEQNIRKLVAGRLDLVIESKAIMDYTLKEMHLEKEVRRLGGTPQGDVYVAFSPALAESKERAQRYDEAIKSLEKAGKIAPLYKKYGLVP